MDLKMVLMIVATGVPGFISYWILSQFKLFDITENNKDDKVLLLTSLSVLNVIISYMFCDYKDINFNDITYINLIKIIFFSLVVVVINSIIIYPLLIIFIKKYVLFFQNKLSMPVDNNKTIIENIMVSRPKNTDTQIYMFDFDNKLIIEGGLGFVSNISQQLSIRNIVDIETTYEQAMKLYQQTENQYREIFLDYDKKIKIIFIHF